MSDARRFALLIAATLAASLGACGGGGGDAPAPTAPPGPTTPSIATVAVTASTPVLSPGQSTQLAASAARADGQGAAVATFAWLSETPAVATVDATGRVTAVSPGTAVIAATAGAVRGSTTITVRPGPAAPLADLTRIVDSVRLAWKLPAIAAAIVTLEDGLVAVGAAGTRRASGGPAVTSDDRWHLGSNTKAMTALLAAAAVAQDRIGWTTTIAQAFPELASVRAEYRDVTLRELLSHQSGLTPILGNAALGTGTTAAAQRASAVAAVLQQPPPSGTTRGAFEYNNVGYVVAGAMLERALGTSFEAAMATHVFTPLGMTDAAWGPQAAAGSTTQPVAHRRQSDGSWTELEGYDLPPVFNSSGTMHMSLASWGRFVREVLRVEAGTSTVAPADVARQTTSPAVAINATASYGMGWGIASRAWANGKVLDHTGSNLGNASLAVLAPARNVAFLVATNGYDPAGLEALSALHGRLVAFHTTGR
ncbi:serine hydrolase [Roseisolibacter sp. H3M3-2]|uniref:serine hydrolase n=1 Tax=Roseisolibacter sp. H3M3-2 TaxID=3031323 RepID=UPI0023DC6F73|nr:serine hydrolase [Roseisolibacter sp. H3M3-2]MDF1504638.1 serine hydrolase [Roseisolibacter sp. H3M3-2]